MISVILCAYNAEGTIDKAIGSIMASTYQNIELLAIDDGSVDGTWQIICDWSKRDSRVKPYHKENTGVANSRNFGMERANGEWITFADADDTIDACIYEKCGEVIRAASPDIIVFDYTRVIGGRIQPNNSQIRLQANTLLNREYIDANLIPAILHFNKEKSVYTIGFSVCNKVYKKSLLNNYKIRFKDERRTFEDGIFNAEYLKWINTCFYIPMVGYYYAVTEGSITHSLHDEMLDILLDNYRCYYRLYAAYLIGENRKCFQAYFCDTILQCAGEIACTFRANEACRVKAMFHRMIEDETTQTIFAAYLCRSASQKVAVEAVRRHREDSFYRLVQVDWIMQKWTRRAKKLLKRM